MATCRIGRSLAALLLAGCTLAAGCSQGTRACVPTELLKSGQFLAVNAPYEANKPVEPDVVNEVLTRFQQEGRPAPGARLGRQYRILALSGGGAYGAYSAGVLAGY